jgi:hypothetical protein
VPPTDAARVLFEYLTDLASEMILNGATPEMVVSFLASEGCPASVARTLERDLRDRVQPAPSEPPAPAAPSPAPQEPARSFPRWVAATAPVVAACVLAAWLVARPARSPAPAAVVAPPAAVAAAPAAPPAPSRPSPQQGARPAAREHKPASLGAASADLDAERELLEADQKRFAAKAAELAAERGSIEAAEAALASSSDVEQVASLAPRKAAYNARLQAARRTEKALQQRVHDLNARITAYNERVRSPR